MTTEIRPQAVNEQLDYGHPLEFAYFLAPDAGDPAAVLETARLADSLGYDLLGVQDHPYQPRHLDTQSLLATILAQTGSVRVFAAVGNLPLRPPAVLAKSAATLDLLSGGRFELGIGAGGYLEAAHAMGAPTRTPGESLVALEEAIEIMRAMWSGERRGLRFDGSHYQLSGVHPGPVPAHAIEIWIGANRPRALALTGRAADGWVSPLMNYKPPHEAAEGNRAIDLAARAAGRNPRDIRRIFLIPGAFTSVPQAPGSDSDQAIVGPPEHWAEALTHFATDLGFSTFVLAAAPDPEALRIFIEDVAPKVRQRVAERRAEA
jgi:alkanesulfonate monooxygenase SsuD/methylene tetrahydromethanopterin reductase-like flavin-dependent oxidoreductase (luciferase family)